MSARRPVRRALLGVIGFYSRAISPALPPRCRFYPTCSAYAAEAIERHGAARGTWLALRRLAKCAPWHPGGADLVPSGTTDADRASSTTVTPEPTHRLRHEHGLPPSTTPTTAPTSPRAPQQEAGVV